MSKKMTFREQLNKVRELGINFCDLIIADECECVFNFEYTEQEFEKLCEKAKMCYLGCNRPIIAGDIADAFNRLINDEELSIEEVLEIDKWTIIDRYI